ncbi:MAG: hypothetical protein BWX86_02748 [Verrucomicrobia bacterium ADurb.Bin122]|nr:MAG: hypothetical protein BWX86_02748 [Verrucomicrobia bacterium ADurb.Bin122]
MPAFSLMPALKSVAFMISGSALMNGGSQSMTPYGVAQRSFIVLSACVAWAGVAAPDMTPQTWVFMYTWPSGKFFVP